MTRSLIFYLVVLMLLTACAGSANNKSDAKTMARKSAELNTSMGREYMDRGKFEIALEKLKKAIAADPDYAPGHTVLAVLYERLGESEKAGRHYRLAVEAVPENGDVNNNYGVFLCHSGDRKLADSYFKVAMKDPFYQTPAVLFANAGSCELEANHIDKAISYLRQSLEYDAKFPDSLLTMTNAQARSGDFMRARAFLQRYEEVGPLTAQSLSLGWQIESSLGNAGSANAYKDKLLNRFPETEQAAQMRSSQNP